VILLCKIVSLKVVDDYMKPKDLKKVLAIVKEHQTDFEEKWGLFPISWGSH
jgi:hypothetical protein